MRTSKSFLSEIGKCAAIMSEKRRAARKDSGKAMNTEFLSDFDVEEGKGKGDFKKWYAKKLKSSKMSNGVGDLNGSYISGRGGYGGGYRT